MGWSIKVIMKTVKALTSSSLYSFMEVGRKNSGSLYHTMVIRTTVVSVLGSRDTMTKAFLKKENI